jgi:hypothetical protein
MKNLPRLLLALVAVSAVASFSGAWNAPQDPAVGKPEKLGQGRPGEGRQGRGAQNLGQKQAALKKAMPSLKTSLAEAIALAEKETGGKTFAAGIELKDGKPLLVVNVFTATSERGVTVFVDHETKKAVVQVPKKEGKEGEAGAGEGEEGG